MAISSFCSQCGAKSVAGETYCSACQQPLNTVNNELDDKPTLLQGRYQLLKEIGAGGFGAVYLAQDTQEQNRSVAIKQIHLQGLTPQEMIEATDAFNREAEILSTLSHPLLPKIFDRFSDPEHWYLVINFIDGLTLDEYLQQQVARALPARRGLPLAETLTIALQLCEVLHYLHVQQPAVIFRDLKPGNVMLTTSDKRLYLIDFGIARRFKPGQAKDTVPFGSPGFAAPEQYGRAQTTPQADIYSLGALLYCLISSDNPADHPFQFSSLRLDNISGAYSSAGVHKLNALIQRMVATDPAQRPADMLEVRAELQRIQQIQIQATGTHIWTPPPGQTPTTIDQQQVFLSPIVARRKTTRRRVLTGSLFAGGALLVGGIAVYAANHQGPQPEIQANNAPADNAIATTAVKNYFATSTATAEANLAVWSSNLQNVATSNNKQNQIDIFTFAGAQNQMKQIARLNAPGPNFSLQWSPDNKYILINNSDIWSIQNEQRLFQLLNAQEISSTNAIAWSPNGKYLAVGRDTSMFQIIDALRGTLLFQQSFSTLAVTSIAWSIDSKNVIVPVSDAAGTWHLEIWNVQTQQKILTISDSSDFDNTSWFTTSIDQITGIFCAPDHQQIAFLFAYGIWFCNITGANSINNLNGYRYTSDQQPLVWSPNAKYLATLTDWGLLVYDIAGGYMNIPTVATNLVALAWSANSKSITTIDNKNNRSQFTVTLP
jgi:eukaryotic-like serine/threonine-protein kinase